MIKKILLLSCLLGVSIQSMKAQKTGNNNPIIPDLIADPSIVQFGDTFIAMPQPMATMRV